MKNLLAATFGAALLAGAVAAGAATLTTQAKQSAGEPVMASVAQTHMNDKAPWNIDLAHQTGGAR